MIVLAIDPGSKKCGLAVVERESGVLHREIVATDSLPARVAELVARFAPDATLLGDGTRSKLLEEGLPVPVIRVAESHTTERARLRYWRENPPAGLARLWPISLRTPPTPVDDWVAVILAEDWLSATVPDGVR